MFSRELRQPLSPTLAYAQSAEQISGNQLVGGPMQAVGGTVHSQPANGNQQNCKPQATSNIRRRMADTRSTKPAQQPTSRPPASAAPAVVVVVVVVPTVQRNSIDIRVVVRGILSILYYSMVWTVCGAAPNVDHSLWLRVLQQRTVALGWAGQGRWVMETGWSSVYPGGGCPR